MSFYFQNYEPSQKKLKYQDTTSVNYENNENDKNSASVQEQNGTNSLNADNIDKWMSDIFDDFQPGFRDFEIPISNQFSSESNGAAQYGMDNKNFIAPVNGNCPTNAEANRLPNQDDPLLKKNIEDMSYDELINHIIDEIPNLDENMKSYTNEATDTTAEEMDDIIDFITKMIDTPKGDVSNVSCAALMPNEQCPLMPIEQNSNVNMEEMGQSTDVVAKKSIESVTTKMGDHLPTKDIANMGYAALVTHLPDEPPHSDAENLLAPTVTVTKTVKKQINYKISTTTNMNAMPKIDDCNTKANLQEAGLRAYVVTKKSTEPGDVTTERDDHLRNKNLTNINDNSIMSHTSDKNSYINAKENLPSINVSKKSKEQLNDKTDAVTEANKPVKIPPIFRIVSANPYSSSDKNSYINAKENLPPINVSKKSKEQLNDKTNAVTKANKPVKIPPIFRIVSANPYSSSDKNSYRNGKENLPPINVSKKSKEQLNDKTDAVTEANKPPKPIIRLFSANSYRSLAENQANQKNLRQLRTLQQPKLMQQATKLAAMGTGQKSQMSNTKATLKQQVQPEMQQKKVVEQKPIIIDPEFFAARREFFDTQENLPNQQPKQQQQYAEKLPQQLYAQEWQQQQEEEEKKEEEWQSLAPKALNGPSSTLDADMREQKQKLLQQQVMQQLRQKKKLRILQLKEHQQQKQNEELKLLLSKQKMETTSDQVQMIKANQIQPTTALQFIGTQAQQLLPIDNLGNRNTMQLQQQQYQNMSNQFMGANQQYQNLDQILPTEMKAIQGPREFTIPSRIKAIQMYSPNTGLLQQQTQMHNTNAQFTVTPSTSNIQIQYHGPNVPNILKYLTREQTQYKSNNPFLDMNYQMEASDLNTIAHNNAQLFRSFENVEEELVVDEDCDYEEIGVADTYANYFPSKLQFGLKHPDAVVETASLSSVKSINIEYKLKLPANIINSGSLSSLQLEAIIYACQSHYHMLPDGKRAGFFLGDGPGVGKGRTIAGIIYENYIRKRKRALWISVSNDLKFDAERDLRDIGAEFIKVHSLCKFNYSKITEQNRKYRKGVIFCTYSSLIGESHTITNRYGTRITQLLDWCGDDFDGLIVFDECHKAKNLNSLCKNKSSKTAATVLKLQNLLPRARIVYASATGASEPRNMAYMVRLGLWGEGTPFSDFSAFLSAVEQRGVSAMEIVAMDMKLRGIYIARQLSFKEVSFRIDEVKPSKRFRRIYNRAVDLWVNAMYKFEAAAALINIDKNIFKTIWCQFWCAHQRFFKFMCIASKVDHAVNLARSAIVEGKCVVIGLQSTGEACTQDYLEKNGGVITKFISTAKHIFLSFVEKNFPAPQREEYEYLQRTGKIDKTKMMVKKRKKMDDDDFDIDLDMYDLNACLDHLFSTDDEDDDDNDDQNDDDMEDSNESCEEFDSYNNKHKPKAKSTGRKRKRGRPRKTSSNGKTEIKYAIQHRILEMLKEKLGINENNRIKTDVHGMPLRRTIEEETLENNIESAINMRESLICSIEKLGHKLPVNTIDYLIEGLGGTSRVAEMTGRRGRVITTADGNIKYDTRCEPDVNMESINLLEKQRFMDGRKMIAIISEAASSGISLHSDRRCFNQRRRVHITMELPWSADRAVQQFGRTHRSNQVNAPEYIFLISKLAGERRFAATVAKRLESLGALTHGDRRATDTRDLSQFNIDNKYGRKALEMIMKTITGEMVVSVKPPKDYKGNFFDDCAKALIGVGMILPDKTESNTYALDKDYTNIEKFLNRILGCHVELQNALFKYFNDTLNYIIENYKRSGCFDLGILDLGANGENVTLLQLVRFTRKHATGTAPTELHTVSMARGLSWTEAINIYSNRTKPYESFYITKNLRQNKYGIILAVEDKSQLEKAKSLSDSKLNRKSKRNIKLRIYRPNTGKQVRCERLRDIEGRYIACPSEEAKPHWEEHYSSSDKTCSHVYWSGYCLNGPDCQVGLRDRIYHVLSGSVLPIWSRVETIINANNSNDKMQVIRVKTTQGHKLVGTLIPKNCYKPLISDLKSDSEKVSEQIY